MIARYPMALSGAEIGAWVAACAGVVAIGKQVWDGIKNRRRELKQIDEALDRAPEVRQQLELGNIGEAVQHLNTIITSQSAALGRSAEDNERLREHLQSAEAEADGWEHRFDECEESRRKLEAELARVTAQAEADRRNFARALAQAREEREGGEG